MKTTFLVGVALFVFSSPLFAAEPSPKVRIMIDAMLCEDYGGNYNIISPVIGGDWTMRVSDLTQGTKFDTVQNGKGQLRVGFVPSQSGSATGMEIDARLTSPDGKSLVSGALYIDSRYSSTMDSGSCASLDDVGKVMLTISAFPVN